LGTRNANCRRPATNACRRRGARWRKRYLRMPPRRWSRARGQRRARARHQSSPGTASWSATRELHWWPTSMEQGRAALRCAARRRCQPDSARRRPAVSSFLAETTYYH
jgi:hypothetical protein